MSFDINAVRAQFPALGRMVGDRPAVWFDGPGGSQMPQSAIDAVSGVLESGVSNLGAPWEPSRVAVRVVSGARSAMADFLNAPAQRHVAFGQSMTALTLQVARVLAKRWGPGDEIVLTRLDHDANVSPWLIAAEESGATIRWVDFDPEDGCALSPVEEVLSERTKLLAITHASNALGTIPDVAAACVAARQAGALTYVDAVHFAAHEVIDVSALDCDFLACSAYKFHGPHVGVLYLGPRVIDEVEPVRIRPAPSAAPGSWEPGTPSFELLAGVTAAVDYLASNGVGVTRRQRLVSGITAALAHTDTLVDAFFDRLEAMDHVVLYGPGRGRRRTATFAIEVAGHTPAEVTRRLGEAGIFTWDGHYYALEALRRLGRLERGGLTRVGFLHYNTVDEVERLSDLLEAMA